MHIHNYFVYILTNDWGNVMYVGLTNDLTRRVQEHRDKVVPGFTSRYNVRKLVYFEQTNLIDATRNREKQIKGWTRAKKNALVDTTNPLRRDLSADLG